LSIESAYTLFALLNILFVANRIPYPPFRGDKLKIFNLTRRIAKRHKLYLATFYESRSELEYVKELKPYFEHIELVYLPQWRSIINGIPALVTGEALQVAYFKHPKMHKVIDYILNTYHIDVIHTQHLRMSQYTRDLSYPKILDLPDAYSLYYKRRNETERPLLGKLIDKIEIGRLVNREKDVLQYNKTLVCSKEDKVYLKKLHKAENIDILMNGVDLSTFDIGEGHDYCQNINVVFTGNMNYAPNVDAVVYFAKELWPKVLQEHPQARFIIAGQKPTAAVQSLVSDSIEVTGFVPKIQDVYKNAAVVVAPLRFGAGTQNKVLESMAMGVPVVCTHIGFEGLGIKNGEGVYKASNSDDFSNKVIELLSDEHYRKQMGQQAHQIATTTFSWDVIAQQLEDYFLEVLNPIAS
jgi:sugar transferase (PEP-CTERM/EpsH1 system associated)